MAAIFDFASKTSTGSGASSLSWNHTIGGGGGNRLLVVCIEGEYNSSSPLVSVVTYNGIALTFLSRLTGSGSHSCHVEMWALWGNSMPAAGAHTITVSWNSNVNLSQAAGAMSFFNVKAQSSEATAANSANGGGSISAGLTTLTPNALLVTAYGSQNAASGASATNDAQAFSSVPSSGESSECDGFYRTVISPSPVTVTINTSNPEGEAIIIASFQTVAATGGAAILPAFF